MGTRTPDTAYPDLVRRRRAQPHPAAWPEQGTVTPNLVCRRGPRALQGPCRRPDTLPEHKFAYQAPRAPARAGDGHTKFGVSRLAWGLAGALTLSRCTGPQVRLQKGAWCRRAHHHLSLPPSSVGSSVLLVLPVACVAISLPWCVVSPCAPPPGRFGCVASPCAPPPERIGLVCHTAA